MVPAETKETMVSDAERAGEVLGEILARMGIAAVVKVSEDEEQILLDVQGPESGLVIGKQGQTLDSLQYLVARIVHRDRHEADFGKLLVVDAEQYRARRRESLVALAHEMGEKAIRTCRPVAVNPMSPHDRRIMHLALDKVPGVTTQSEGEGSFRRLVILPKPEKV